jgi:predicted metal-dependent phosphotriesterase family hydrolase
LMTNVVPDLLKSGFSQKEIDTFMIDNPRRYFCGA